MLVRPWPGDSVKMLVHVAPELIDFSTESIPDAYATPGFLGSKRTLSVLLAKTWVQVEPPSVERSMPPSNAASTFCELLGSTAMPPIWLLRNGPWIVVQVWPPSVDLRTPTPGKESEVNGSPVPT